MSVVMALGSPLGGSFFLCDVSTPQRRAVPNSTLQRGSLAVLPRADGRALYFEDQEFVVRVLDISSGEQVALPTAGREHLLASVILR